MKRRFDIFSGASLQCVQLNSPRLFYFPLFLYFALCWPAKSWGCDASDDTDYPKSVALAKKTNRPLLLAFLGTDWSLSSLKLDREVFDEGAFADDSKYNYLLCKVHFYQTQERPREIVRQNEDLAVKYRIERFPTVVVLSPEGAELGRTGYIPGGVEKFATTVNQILIKARSSQEH